MKKMLKLALELVVLPSVLLVCATFWLALRAEQQSLLTRAHLSADQVDADLTVRTWPELFEQVQAVDVKRALKKCQCA
jgi:hypothetical protein